MASIFNRIFNRAPVADQSTKAYSAGRMSSIGSRHIGPGPVSISESLHYYQSTAPLYTAVKLIADEFSSLKVVVADRKSGTYLKSHPVLDLLSSPNTDLIGDELLAQIASFYTICGNVFILATGPISKAPLELIVLNPSTVQLEASSTDGYLQKITVGDTSNGRALTFNRAEIGGRFRYVNDIGEVWHIKTFSGKYNAGELYGMSPLSPIGMELRQYQEAAVHNLSTLKRGARPSGALSFNEPLTDEQFTRIEQQANQFYSGANNAGRVIVLEKGQFTEMSMNMKDMDFVQLRKDITTTIYNSLKIPLAMINSEFSTYNNLETAKLNFYDNAIMPLSQRIMEELSVFLLPRYKAFDKYALTVDKTKIDALSPRRSAEIALLERSHVLTINELREQIGYAPLEGGDTIYMNGAMLPVDEIAKATAYGGSTSVDSSTDAVS